jgi:molybdopterin-guanine dinucleotide biosynthesis protein A
MPDLSKPTANISQPPTVTGLVLAGGRGSRMGGCNKGLLNYKQKPLVVYAAQNLMSVAKQILVCSNTEKEAYLTLGFTVIDDGEFAWQGPLAGINAGFEACDSAFLAIIACDQLTLPEYIYPTLLKAAQNSSAKAAFASDGNRMHPTCAVVHCSQHAELRENLLHDKLRVGWWLKEIGADMVEFTGVEFSNINNREDLK